MTQETQSLTGYQLRVLAVLALVNFVNFAERGLVPPLLPLLRDAFGASSAQLGLLQVVLQAVLAAASIPFGFFADRWSRTRVISFGVIFAGLATILSGMATTFTMLLAARALVGVGEAAITGPTADDVVIDLDQCTEELAAVADDNGFLDEAGVLQGDRKSVV